MKPFCRSLIWIAAYMPMGRLTPVLLSLALKGWPSRAAMAHPGASQI